MEDGRYFDMVPTETGGSDETYYADYYSCSSVTDRVVCRSNNSTQTNTGVSYVNAGYASSFENTSIGSRLAFRGTITEAASVEEYKKLFE